MGWTEQPSNKEIYTPDLDAGVLTMEWNRHQTVRKGKLRIFIRQLGTGTVIFEIE